MAILKSKPKPEHPPATKADIIEDLMRSIDFYYSQNRDTKDGLRLGQLPEGAAKRARDSVLKYLHAAILNAGSDCHCLSSDFMKEKAMTRLVSVGEILSDYFNLPPGEFGSCYGIETSRVLDLGKGPVKSASVRLITQTGEEVWKRVSARPDYDVSTYGNVRRRGSATVLSAACLNGYGAVRLGGFRTSIKTFRVARLVAEAFLDLSPAQMVMFKNRDKMDARVNNLVCVDDPRKEVKRAVRS